MEEFFKVVLIPSGFIALIAAIPVFIAMSREHRGFWTIKDAVATGVSNSRFILTNGKRSDFYYDADLLLAEPQLIGTVTDWYVNTIAELKRSLGRIDKLAFIERDSGPIGALSLAGCIAYRTSIPTLVVRTLRRFLFTALKGARPAREGEIVVVISDLITTGRSLLNTVETLREAGAIVPAAVALVNRGGDQLVTRLENEHALKVSFAESIHSEEDLKTGPMLKALEKKKGSPLRLPFSSSPGPKLGVGAN